MLVGAASGVVPEVPASSVGGRVATRCGELLGQIAAERGWEIVAAQVMPDHLQLFVRVA